jgi:hypothetical protein
MGKALACAVVVFVMSLPSAIQAQTQTAPPLRPAQIYNRMQAAVNRLPLPAFIAFTFQNEGTTLDYSQNGIIPTREILRVLVRVADGRAVLVPLKDPDGDDVAKPAPRLVTASEDYQNVSNIIRLGDFPIATFGLRYNSLGRADFFVPSSPSPEASPLRVIATVEALAPVPYALVDLGDTTIDGRAMYHLGLKPLHDPDRYVLRQIWIDQETYLPRRYIAHRDVLGLYSYLITVDTALIGPYLVNTTADGDAYMNGRGAWSICQVTFPEFEPDWVFNGSEWAHHIGDRIPNLAPDASLAQCTGGDTQ